MLDSLRQNGWATVRNVNRAGVLDLAHTLGMPWSRSGAIIEELRIRDHGNAPPCSLSGMHGRGAFPLHTDFAHCMTPPRYVLLRSTSAAPVRPTLVQPLDGLARSEVACRTLRRRVWVVRGGPVPFYAPLLFGAGTFVRWDSACMSPGALATDALGAWTNCLASANPFECDWELNTVLVIDNWRTLHGRAGSSMKSDDERVLERIVISQEVNDALG
jgi:hypothetical protein